MPSLDAANSEDVLDINDSHDMLTAILMYLTNAAGGKIVLDCNEIDSLVNSDVRFFLTPSFADGDESRMLITLEISEQ
jgi:hypothetical protein